MMLYQSETYLRDLDRAIAQIPGIEKLNGSAVLITGATGTIGSFLADLLKRRNETCNAGIQIYAAGRSAQRLESLFGPEAESGMHFAVYDMLQPVQFRFHADYILHAAGNAHPAAFNGDPVGTILGNVNGTHELLQYGSSTGAERLLYVSSGEVYGQGDLRLDAYEEAYAGYLDVGSPRSCYPMSKRAAENLCASYTRQFGLETVTVRPCHTYGPGITPTDSRANAQFFRNVLAGQDIVMKSAGTQLRSYNYIADCASGAYTVLLNGTAGEAYNLANPAVRVTIAELARTIAACAGRAVRFENPDAVDLANQTPIAKQVLDTGKLEQLGWQGAFDLKTGVEHTISILKDMKKQRQL